MVNVKDEEIEFDKYDKLGAYHWASISNDITKHNLHAYQQYNLVVDLVVDLITDPEQKILDVGSGDGALSHLLAKKGCKVYGIDSSKTAIALAKSKTSKMNYSRSPRFFVDSVYGYSPKMKFDIIIMCDVIEHLSEPDSAIDHLKKIVKSDGKIIITTPKSVGGGKKIDEYHFKEYNQKELEQFLSQHFKNVVVIGAISSWLIDFYKKCGRNKVLVYVKWFLNFLSIKGFNFYRSYEAENKYTNLVAVCSIGK
jgi:2-polyprenyl-3-methyl-5-hydroxy-6-metoxy-1,4-benzoquinol methylase